MFAFFVVFCVVDAFWVCGSVLLMILTRFVLVLRLILLCDVTFDCSYAAVFLI